MVASWPGVGVNAGSAKRSRSHCSRSRQLRRLRLASTSAHALGKATDGRVIRRGRTREERQMVVGVAVILVDVEMADGDVRGQLVKVAKVVVMCRGTEIGMTDVQAHAHGAVSGRLQLVQV